MLNWKIAGQAGSGIAVTGTMFAKLCMRQGLHVFTYGEYPSLIRGGHNTIQVAADPVQATSQVKLANLLVALNKEGVTLHLNELDAKSIIILDSTQVKLDPSISVPGTIVDLPSHALAIEHTGSGLAANMVTLGASCYILGLDITILHTLIEETFTRKGQEVVARNQAAAEAGFAHVQQLKIPAHKSPQLTPSPQVYVSGNEAIGLGALAGGIQFYAAYPMTPASSLLDFLADQQARYPLVVKHAEDEIGAINQAVGASFAGARAMVGTSGGGFALMVEALSLAAMTEVPLVVMEGQRPGPATGLPTWTGQADLQFVLNAGHGEFDRVVLAPGDIEEAFIFSRLAFMVAEQWQTQVYLLTDKFLIESSQSVPEFASAYTNNRYNMVSSDLPEDNSYQRYAITPLGYSPRSIPGQPHGLQLTNSYEHDEHGYATEDADLTIKMTDKRLRKLNTVLAVLPQPKLIGPAQAKVTFVSWGSTKLVITEAIKQLNANKEGTANAIHLGTLAPFPKAAFLKLAKAATRLIIVEGNAKGQGESLIHTETDLKFDERINRYDGRPFYPEDLVAYIQNGAKV